MPTIETLFLLVLSILAMESEDSIRSLYRHFLSGITEKSLNAFYYACSYAQADYSKFINITAGIALKLIPEKLRPQPVFLCIDDTMASKFGKKFEDVSKLFDHARLGSAIYDLPPQRTGKRGRPALHGKKLSIHDDFILSTEKIGDYYIAARSVLTNIFGSRRLFLAPFFQNR